MTAYTRDTQKNNNPLLYSTSVEIIEPTPRLEVNFINFSMAVSYAVHQGFIPYVPRWICSLLTRELSFCLSINSNLNIR